MNVFESVRENWITARQAAEQIVARDFCWSLWKSAGTIM